MDRTRSLGALTEGTYDLLVVGGGVTGAGVAREASLRGFRVALVEQGDFDNAVPLLEHALADCEQWHFDLLYCLLPAVSATPTRLPVAPTTALR